jgi:hypothetical protein
MDIPADYLNRMQGFLVEEFPAFAAGYNRPPVNDLRVNTLKLNEKNLSYLINQEFSAEWKTLDFEEIGWCSAG